MDIGNCNYNSIRTQFMNPDEEFSPIPFWFWNDDIKEAELTRQIANFKEKGVDAFIIHPRIGIPKHLQCMSEEFLSLVKHAVAEARRLKKKVILYDEAMYPSGSAHGMVADSNPMYKSRGIRRVTDKAALCKDDFIIYEHDGIYYAEGFTGGTIRGIHFGEDDGEEFAPKSTDLLNKDAVKCFITLTYDKYFEWLGEYFGDTITVIFTDEPSKINGSADCYHGVSLLETPLVISTYLSIGYPSTYIRNVPVRFSKLSNSATSFSSAS